MAAASGKEGKWVKPRDVKWKYLSMGFWKNRIFAKKSRGSQTKSGMARTYIAIPPETGWVGGIPGPQNGLKKGGK